MSNSPQAIWPELPTAAWRETYATLHLWTQIIGKIRLVRSPWLNHSWHVALYATARGLTTSPIPDGPGTFQMDLDFIDHALRISTSDGAERQFAVTRFSGRRAPRHPGGVPNLPDAVASEAYSHEVSSAGFWPGSGAVDYPAFYSYAYPEPSGFRTTKVKPEAAFFSEALGEFVLPYDAVRTAKNPDQALLDFLQSTYEAAAIAAKWDRDALESALGQPGVVRQI